MGVPRATKQVTIYTDGACLDNPGRGGYGVVIWCEEHRQEACGGYQHTTNNRMELMGPIKALETLKGSCQVTLYSDSTYVVDSMTKGRAKCWRANGWRLKNGKKAKNPDLWEQLLDLCQRHEMKFRWIRGHADDPENERCDLLARQAANGTNLPADPGYPTPTQ